MIKKTFSVALCAAALSLCSTTQAQWPARWHETAVSDDEGQAVAVARDGSVYVAGKSKLNSPNWDFALVKYTSAGVKVWDSWRLGPLTPCPLFPKIGTRGLGLVPTANGWLPQLQTANCPKCQLPQLPRRPGAR